MLSYDDIIDGRVRSGESANRRVMTVAQTGIVQATRRIDPAEGGGPYEYEIDVAATGLGGRELLIVSAHSTTGFTPGTAVFYESRGGDPTRGVFVVGPVHLGQKAYAERPMPPVEYSRGGGLYSFAADLFRVRIESKPPVLQIDVPQAGLRLEGPALPLLSTAPTPLVTGPNGGEVHTHGVQGHVHPIEGGSGSRVLPLNILLRLSAPGLTRQVWLSRRVLVHVGASGAFIGLIPTATKTLNLERLLPDIAPGDEATVTLYSHASTTVLTRAPEIAFNNGDFVAIEELSQTGAVLEVVE